MDITYIRRFYFIDKMTGDEDIDWCRCYQADDSSENYMVIADGDVGAIRINGEDDKACDVEKLAETVNPGYDREWYTAEEAALDRMGRCGCRNCPWADVCGAMNDDPIGEIYKVVGDDGETTYYVENDACEIETISPSDVYYPLEDDPSPTEYDKTMAAEFANRHADEI